MGEFLRHHLPERITRACRAVLLRKPLHELSDREAAKAAA
jgi:hypothetical protein